VYSLLSFLFLPLPLFSSTSMSEIQRAQIWRPVERWWHRRESPHRRACYPQGIACRCRAISPRCPEPLPECRRDDGERRLLSMTRTATDSFPHNGGGINDEVGPTVRSSLPFALYFSNLRLGCGDSVFVDLRSIFLLDPFPHSVYH
jgi:hypothetical protein